MKLIKCLCGKVPLVHHVKMLGVPNYHKYRIECECGLNNFHVYDSEDEAIQAWNEIFKEKNFHRSVPAGNERLKNGNN